MGLNESKEVFRLGERQCRRSVPSVQTHAQHLCPQPFKGARKQAPWVLYLLENLVRANYVVCVRAQAGQGSR